MKRLALLGVFAAAAAAGCGYSPAEVREQAIAKFQAGDPEEAEELLKRVFDVEPSDARTLYYMGRIMQVKGLPARAVYFYQCCLDADPSCVDARRRLEEAEEQVGPLGRSLRFIPLRGASAGSH